MPTTNPLLQQQVEVLQSKVNGFRFFQRQWHREEERMGKRVKLAEAREDKKTRIIEALKEEKQAIKTRVVDDEGRKRLQERHDLLEAENGRFRDIMRAKGITNAELLGIDSEVVDSTKLMAPVRARRIL